MQNPSSPNYYRNELRSISAEYPRIGYGLYVTLYVLNLIKKNTFIIVSTFKTFSFEVVILINVVFVLINWREIGKNST